MAKLNERRAEDYDGPEQAEIIDQAQHGDRDAFRLIMQRCNQRLFRAARAVVRDDFEAEDVVQEAYTRGFAKLHTFRGDCDILTWLTRITLNEANGRQRRRRQTITIDEFEAAEQQEANVISFPTTAGADSPEAGAARAEVRRQIEEAVDSLPGIFRTVFILRDVDGCSLTDIAAALDLKPETVRTRLHRARALLRTDLNETLSAPLSGAFPFLGAKCQRITRGMLVRLAPQYGWRD